jgi:hypothetical protein
VFLLPKAVSRIPDPTPEPIVYAPFFPIWQEYEGRLGRAKASEELDDLAHQVSHEHAMVIWFHGLFRFYALFQDGQLELKPDLAMEDSADWLNVGLLRRRFEAPQWLQPPFDGVAKLWSRDRFWQDRVGWGTGQLLCYYYSQVYHQRFDHGYIVGPFRSNSREDFPEAQVYVLLEDDKRWHGEGCKELTAPKCEGPPSNRASVPFRATQRWLHRVKSLILFNDDALSFLSFLREMKVFLVDSQREQVMSPFAHRSEIMTSSALSGSAK